MATHKHGINGTFRGKIGNIVGYEHYGIQCTRSLPRKRTSPPTPKEIINRLKFAASQSWLEPLTEFLRIGFKDYQPTYQGFIAAKSYNQKNALVHDEVAGFTIDPALALVSFGSQTLPSEASVVAKGEQEIGFSWSTDAPAFYSDQAMLIAYDIENKQVRYHTAAARRDSGNATLKLRPIDRGNTFHLYLAFIADDRSEKSNSMYLGSLVIL